MKRKTNKKKAFITVEIQKQQYKNFKHLYDTNKEDIYRGVVQIYEELKSSRKRSLMLLVTTDVGPLSWDTEFIFKKEEYEILVDQILPYYEEIEDYETCAKIKKLHESFENK